MRKINIPIATPITIYEKSSSILIYSIIHQKPTRNTNRNILFLRVQKPVQTSNIAGNKNKNTNKKI
jgi:hypothetical protein